jgi:hypothetical protein
MLRIAGSLHRDLGHCSFDVAEIAHRQCDTRRSDILLQPVEFCRARDGHYPELLSQQPCKRDLSGRGFLFRCNVAEQIDQRLVCLACLRGEPRDDVAEIGAVEFCVLADRAGEKALA